MTSRFSARSLSLPAAILVSLALATQATAATWTLPVKLASSVGVFLDGLVTLSDSTAVAVYVDCGDPVVCYSVRVRRSIDGGATWQPPTVLAPDGYWSAISGLGSKVDVTWVDPGGNVKYVRSTDSGASYASAKTIARGKAAESSVARAPNGVVAVAWINDVNGGGIKTRVSTDGGYSFRATHTVAAGAEGVGNPVAAGDGVVYVAYVSDGVLRVGRSLDFGATWTSSIVSSDLNSHTFHQFSITASGDDAYVAYPNSKGSIRYRRTTDKGETWSADMRLSPADARGSGPQISMQEGVVRAIFNAANGLYYRESSDGVNWSPSETISEIGLDARVGFVGRALVVYDVWVRDGLTEIRSRTRAP